MADPDLGAIYERLFMGFMSPLVIGGVMHTGKPIGGKSALLLIGDRPLIDIDRVAHVTLARVRIARKLAPIDRYDGPSAPEWQLAAVLHDLVQATHPGFDAVFRRKAPSRLINIADLTLERIVPCTSVGDALSRHTWFSRMFELSRTDVVLSWWTGSARFLGEDPPARLMAWPELRRVREDRTPHPLMDLPTSGSVVDIATFAHTITGFLSRTPLTDIATCTRALPAFTWSDATLSLLSTRAGRTLALRTLALLPAARVDLALGRASKFLYDMQAWKALSIALDLLGERSLAEAEMRLSQNADPEPILASAQEGDAGFARGVGALAARGFIAHSGGSFSEIERRRILALLESAASTPVAKEFSQRMGGYGS